MDNPFTAAFYLILSNYYGVFGSWQFKKYEWADCIKKETPPEKKGQNSNLFWSQKKLTNQKFIYLRTPKKMDSSQHLVFRDLWSFKKPAIL